MTDFDICRGPRNFINDLPSELLGEVFTYTLPQSPRFPRARMSEPPLLFFNVCRRWREVALSTPAIWARLSIPDPNTDNYTFFKSSRIISKWFAHAGDMPISFEFMTQCEVLNSTQLDLVLVIVKQLANISHRWHRVKLHLPMNFPTLHELMSLPLPLLSELELNCNLYGDGASHRTLPSTITTTAALASYVIPVMEAPALRTLRVGPTVDLDSPQLNLPWQQITQIHTWIGSSREFVTMLKQSPALRQLILVFSDWWGAYTYQDFRIKEHITHSALKHLVISVRDYMHDVRAASMHLYGVNFPNLDTLVLQSESKYDGSTDIVKRARWCRGAAISIHSILGCKPTRLILSRLFIDQDTLTALLYQHPFVEHLVLRGLRTPHESFLEQLAQLNVGNYALLPRLKYLRVLLDPDVSPVSQFVFDKLISSRTAEDSAATHLELVVVRRRGSVVRPGVEAHRSADTVGTACAQYVYAANDAALVYNEKCDLCDDDTAPRYDGPGSA